MLKKAQRPHLIPRFDDDESAAAFFETHDTGLLWERMKAAKPVRLPAEQIRAMRERHRQRALSQFLGLSGREVAQARKIAHRKSIPVETQLKRWVTEGIRREVEGSRSAPSQ